MRRRTVAAASSLRMAPGLTRQLPEALAVLESLRTEVDDARVLHKAKQADALMAANRTRSRVRSRTVSRSMAGAILLLPIGSPR